MKDSGHGVSFSAKYGTPAFLMNVGVFGLFILGYFNLVTAIDCSGNAASATGMTFGIIFFAYSTILGWSYYGEKCATYLLGEKFVLPYRIIYIATVFIGCIATLDLVWLFADTFNGLMAIPNLIGLLLLSGVIAKESKDFIARRKSGELY